MPKGIPAPGPWDLPGDNVNLENEGLAEGEHIFIRMGTIVRARRLDLRLLMDAHDLHNRGFVDKHTFLRALAYAFGNQWNEVRRLLYRECWNRRTFFWWRRCGPATSP